MARPKTGGASKEILRVTRALFADRGPNGVSIDDIATAAGVARSSVFWHFGSKRGLLRALIEQVSQEGFDRVAGAGDGRRGLDAFEAAVVTRIRLIKDDPNLVRLIEVLLGESLTLEPDLAPVFAKVEMEFLALVTEWFRQAVDDGELAADVEPTALATVATSALAGMVARSLRAGPEYDLAAAHYAVLGVVRSLAPRPGG